MLSLNKWLNSLDRWLNYFSAGTMIVMMLLIFMDVMFRVSLNQPVKGTFEITGEYLLVIIVFLSLSYTYQHGEHVNMDLFISKLSNRLQLYFKLIVNMVMLVFLTLLLIANFEIGLEYFAKDIRSISTLEYPIGPAFMIISVGVLTLIVRIALESVLLIFKKSLNSKH